MKKFAKLACHVVNSNIAIGPLPTLQISPGTVALFEKIYHSEPILPSSQISGRKCNTVVSIKCIWCHKCVAARHYADIGKQLSFANNRNRVRGVVLGLSQDGACTNLFENFRENSLKRDLSNNTTVNPPLFSLVNTFKSQSSEYVT
jgi:hypothetical protein